MANKAQAIMKKYKSSMSEQERIANLEAELALDSLIEHPEQPPSFLTDGADPDTTSINSLNNLFQGDPVLEGTGQPGELYGAPTTPSPEWLEYQENLETEAAMDSLGLPRDPMLEGTGQPGELYGAPTTPNVSPSIREEAKTFMKKQGLIQDSNGYWQKDPEAMYNKKIQDQEIEKNMSPISLINRDAKRVASWDIAGIGRDPSQPKFSMFDILDDIGLIIDSEVS